MELVPFMMICAGAFLVLVMMWIALSGPSAARVGARRLTGVRERHSGAASLAAMEAQVEVTSLAGSGTVSVLVRYTDANNHYRFVYDNGASEFQLIKASGGTLTTLASISRASVVANLIPPFATLDVTHMRMQFEAIGNKLVAYVNNIQILTATDSSHASGAIALGSDGQSALFDKVLAWIDNMTGSANTYSVYRSTSPQSGYSQVASGLTSPTWVDNTITAGHTYYYKVKAVRSGVESLGDSNVLTVVS